MSRVLTLLVLLTAVGCRESATPHPAVDDGTGLSDSFEYASLQLQNDLGETHEFNVYLALVHEQHLRGLMHVRDLPETTGMLFVYPRTGMRSIWMKNTYIPLDILFIRADGSVAKIDHNATPLTLNSRGSGEPVKYVLELNGGVAKRFNIGTDSRMTWNYDRNGSE